MTRTRFVSMLLASGVAPTLGLLGCKGSDALGAWPAGLVVQSANPQTGLTGFAVNQPPAVRLVDADGNPVSGAEITFTVTAGGGTLTRGVATTGNDGVATVGAWSVAAGANEVTASIPAPFRVAPVSFRATGVAPAYNISLSYITPISPAREAVFAAAAARWQQLIYGDLTDILVNIPAGSCFGNEPPIVGTIDDLLIFVTLDSIDGPGQILGGSAPCFIRSAGKLSLVGVMVFDTADVAFLEQRGAFDDVIVHEMGHVIGFGTLWDAGLLNLIAGAVLDGGTDPHFTGARGIAAFNRIGGANYTASAKVPVENTGGPGTVDSHWRESVFGSELMTGFISVNVANPLSVVTVASLEDEGYRANYAAADGYTLALAVAPGGRVGPAAPAIALGNDILRLPIHMVDRLGHVTGVYRP